MTVFVRGAQSLLYVHIPKTGGTAVEHAFRAAGWKAEFHDGDTSLRSANWFRRCSPQHMHAEDLRNSLILERFNGIFLTVRDPISRFRSEYLMRTMRLDEVPTGAREVERWASARFREYQRNPWVLDNHLRPQSEFYLPGAQVYRLEDGLNALAVDLGNRYGFKGPASVPPKQVSRGGTSGAVSSSEVEVSDRLERMLHDFYEEDFRRFGY